MSTARLEHFPFPLHVTDWWFAISKVMFIVHERVWLTVYVCANAVGRVWTSTSFVFHCDEGTLSPVAHMIKTLSRRFVYETLSLRWIYNSTCLLRLSIFVGQKPIERIFDKFLSSFFHRETPHIEFKYRETCSVQRLPFCEGHAD